MNLEDFSRVADAALRDIDILLGKWLPKGVKEGNEYLVGSRYGEAGRSMRIRIKGDKAGYWSDFSAEGDAGRDLISLYAYLNQISQGKACAELARLLGIELSSDAADNRPAPPPRRQEQLRAQAEHPAPEKKSRTEWVPVLPVPDGAGAPPLAHSHRGKPDKSWDYRDQEGRLLGVIYRFRTSDGGKEVLPCVYAEHAQTKARMWRWMAFPEPRPLYTRGTFRPELPVLVVEGEKCADVAHDLLRDFFDVVTWPGGGKAVNKADWSFIANRDVVLWPDADAKTYKMGHERAGEIKPEAEQDGVLAMSKLRQILEPLGCRVSMVDIPPPAEKPDGWDIADLVEEGATADDVLAWTRKLRAPAQAESGAAPAAGEKPKLKLVVGGADESAPDDIPEWAVAPSSDEADYPLSSAGAKPLEWGEIRAMMLPTSTGGVKACRENVFIALKHDPKLQGIVALDKFTQLQVKLRLPPWSSELGEWTEGDDFHLGMYLGQRYGLVVSSIGEIEKAVAQIAREHGFDPVVDYMNECADKWDRQQRIERAFHVYWGAEDSEYIRLVSKLFFVGMAARAFCPGIKHDYAPVFEGGQGKGKSTALSVLGGTWYADTPFRMGEKDGYLSIQGVFLYEIAELEQFNRSEVTAVKAFMSSCMDRYREPYGRRTRNMPRRTLFAATTNEGQYFKDPTGNRRFWPVPVGEIDIAALTRDRDQLFGEAVHMFRQKVRWHPSDDEQRRLITPQQEDREIPDPWIGRIYDYLEGIDAEGIRNLALRRDMVTVRELLTKALHIEIGKLGPAKMETMRISTIMRKLGWVKDRQTSGAREYFYTRPKDPEPEVEEEDADVLPL